MCPQCLGSLGWRRSSHLRHPWLSQDVGKVSRVRLPFGEATSWVPGVQLHLHFPLHLLRWLSDFCQVCLSVVLHLLIFVSQGEPTWSWSFSSFSSLSAACCSLFLEHSKKSSYCILVFCLYVCVCTMCAWYPQSPEESNRSLETGNTNLCELSCRCQELTLKSLQEQGEILTTEPPLQLPFSDLLKVFRTGEIVLYTGRVYYSNITYYIIHKYHIILYN